MSDPIRVGVIGTGAISGAYLGMARSFPIIQIAALADIDMDKARARGAEFGIARVCSVEELLKDESIDIVLNLTVPKAHVPVALAAIEAGKHTYAEKPLGISVSEGRKVLEAAGARGLRVGCAPDTFMGAGIQTARKLIDDGAIGRPVAFTAFMMIRGHESWHPSPEFYYQAGGGPMFDMGPYYLTALLNILGPIRRIMGAASIAIPERTITSKPKFGQKIKVETPDHICGTIEFENGVVGSIITTFATRFAQYDGKQPITIYGEEGTLKVPDPNTFDGPVHIRKTGEDEFKEVPHMFPRGFGRAVGLADMAHGIRAGRPHRASGEQAFAVLEAMQAFLDSSAQGKAIAPTVKYQRPAPMPQRVGLVLD
jgi:predicted dehydrogenase